MKPSDSYQWVKDRLEGKTISEARYLSEEEARVLGWPLLRPLRLVFTDGTCVYMSDKGRIVTDDGQTIPAYFEKGPAVSYEESGRLIPGSHPVHPFDESS